jgi:hypothetical protein
MNTYGLSIESVKDRDGKVEAFRAIIFEQEMIEGNPVLSVSDIVEVRVEEGEPILQALLNLQGFWSEWDEAKKVTAVWMGHGLPMEYPDEISVWEAAECVAAFPRDLFNQDPLGLKK